VFGVKMDAVHELFISYLCYVAALAGGNFVPCRGFL
jgi:hypothetical protein